MAKRGRSQAAAARPPTEGEQVRCKVCWRWHLRTDEVCPTCNLTLPVECACDALTPPARPPRDGYELTGTHRHLTNELLALWFQLGVEGADGWTEHLIAESWWEKSEGALRIRGVEDDAAFKLKLAAYPILASLAKSKDGEAAIFRFADVPELEAEAYVIHVVNGYTVAAAAKRLGVRESVVLQRVANATHRLSHSLRFAAAEAS